MTTPQHDASPQRTATRAPVGKPIKLQFDGVADIIEGNCRNISIGGMFIEVDAVPSQGSLVRFELTLDEENAIRGLSEVVWARPKSFGPGHESGIGIKFRFLEQRDRQLIFKLVSQYIKERLASRPPMTADPMPPPAAVEGIFKPPDPPAANPQVREEPRSMSEATGRDPGQRSAGPGSAGPGAAGPGSAAPRSHPATLRPAPPREFAPEQDAPQEVVSRQDVVREEADDSASAQPGVPEPSLDHPSVGRRPEATSQGKPSYFNDAPIDLNAREDEPVWQPDPELTGPVEAPSLEDLRPTAPVQRDTAPPPRVSRRPKNRSSLLPLLILGIILAIIVFSLRDRLFGPPPPMDEPLPSQVEPTVSGQADGTGGRTASRTSGTESSTSTDGFQEQVGTEVPVDSPASAPASSVPSTPPPSISQPSRDFDSTGTEFQRIVDIQWQADGEDLVITVTADGEIPQQRVRNFRLDGDVPREVIQLLGIGRGYDSGALAVNGPGVKQIRIGLNERQGRKELRLVLDLTGPSARLTDLTASGNFLTARISVD